MPSDVSGHGPAATIAASTPAPTHAPTPAPTATLRIAVTGGAHNQLADLFGTTVTVDARSLTELLDCGRINADLVVLHTSTPVREITALATLTTPAPPVLVVSPGTSHAQVVPALRAGATSFLVEGEYTRADLLDAIHSTAGGQSRLSPSALTAVVRHVRRPDAPQARPGRQPLTRREQQIMDLVTAGHSNAQIADQLGLAEKTIRNQVSRVYKKLRVRSRTEAIVDWLNRQ